MERYLAFQLSEDEAEQSLFSDYTLNGTTLLPSHFGSIAPINIFLGENNSGKSRFMREIMKSTIKILDLAASLEKLNKIIDDSIHLTKGIDKSNLYTLQIDLRLDKIDNETLHLLTLEGKQARNTSSFYYELDNNLIELVEFLKKLANNFKSLEALLDFVNNADRQNNVVEYIIGILIVFEKAALVYESLRPAGYMGKDYANVWQTDSIKFSLGIMATVALRVGYDKSTLFNDRDFRDNFFHNNSLVLTKIVEYLMPLAKMLRVLIVQQHRGLSKSYIPTLRTARTLTNNKGIKVDAVEDIMRHTTIADYDLKDSNIQVITGLGLYNDINAKRNTSREGREEFKEFEKFLSETFFDGKEVEVVAQHDSNNILVSVAKEERMLPYLGDGIQSIILLLYPLFTARKGAWIFIEEPETHMHPGFQRLFIETIAKHKVLLEKNLIIFLTTHSNHLLDFAQEEANNINLFAFRKSIGDSREAKYQIQLTAYKDLSCLTALGVQNSSVFLSNCTIWVEGITDRLYLKAYLAAYLKHRNQAFSLLEGLHYSFLEYAGANVSHYAFGVKAQQATITNEVLEEIQALSISNRIMLIADQDSGKETKHQQRSEQQHTGFEYVVIPTREIENLLTPEVIVGALKKLYSKQARYFNATKLKQIQYKSIYLAKHLQGKFAELPDSFVGSSGTVSSAKKRQFAEKAVEEILSWDMLSLEAQELTKRLYQFIMGHNPRLGSN